MTTAIIILLVISLVATAVVSIYVIHGKMLAMSLRIEEFRNLCYGFLCVSQCPHCGHVGKCHMSLVDKGKYIEVCCESCHKLITEFSASKVEEPETI
jgi:hypothetical protein